MNSIAALQPHSADTLALTTPTRISVADADAVSAFPFKPLIHKTTDPAPTSPPVGVEPGVAEVEPFPFKPLIHLAAPPPPPETVQTEQTQPQAETHEKARDAARELVALAFLHPMLAETREDPFQSEMFHGGQGEKLFRARLDELTADRMSKSMRMPLADAVYRRMMRLGPASPTPAAAHTRLNLNG